MTRATWIETGVEGVAAAHLVQRKSSTGTDDRLTIVWATRALKCCATQAWEDCDDPPLVWDASGVGTWQIAPRMRCGGCGTVLCCRCELRDGHLTDDEINKLAQYIADDHEE